MKAFYALLGFNGILPLICLVFFWIGLTDGTVSGRNLHIWILMLGVPTLLLYAGYWLYRHGKPEMAWAIGIVQAIPSVLALVFFLIVLFGDVRWN